MAWYEDIKAVTERTPEERINLARENSRSISRASQRSPVSSDGVGDEEDPPFMANVASVNQTPRPDSSSRRPSGGRFPSDLQVNAQRGLQVPVSPVSVSSSYDDGFNHHDPFMTSAASGGDTGPQSLGFQGVSLARRIEREPQGGPVQYPSTAGAPAASDPAGHPASARVQSQQTGGTYDGPTWAEPVPIPLPHQAQPLSSSRNTTTDSVGGDLYNSQGTATANGDHISGRLQPGMSYGADMTQHGMSGPAVENEVLPRPGSVMRTDSVPTISKLHIPGGYPRGSNAGL